MWLLILFLFIKVMQSFDLYTNQQQIHTGFAALAGTQGICLAALWTLWLSQLSVFGPEPAVWRLYGHTPAMLTSWWSLWPMVSLSSIFMKDSLFCLMTGDAWKRNEPFDCHSHKQGYSSVLCKYHSTVVMHVESFSSWPRQHHWTLAAECHRAPLDEVNGSL